MRWGTIGMGGAWVLIGGPMRWGTNEMGDQWDGGPLGLAENGWTNEKGDQWEGGPMSSNNVVGDLWIGAPMRRGPMRWGTNEMGDQWVGGTNEMGDQWNEWCMCANWGINEMGDQWDGGPMRWGTNEMGDQWDGGPMMCTQYDNDWGKICIRGNSPKIPHTSPSRETYGVSLVRILVKIDRVITAPHCIWRIEWELTDTRNPRNIGNAP